MATFTVPENVPNRGALVRGPTLPTANADDGVGGPRDVAEMFVISVLQEILREATGRRHAALRKSIKDVLDPVMNLLNEQANAKGKKPRRGSIPPGRRGSVSAKAIGGVQIGYITEKAFPALVLACESRSARVCEMAVDCIQKLLAYRYIGSQEQVDEAVRAICICFAVRDEAVWLQVIKALLAAESGFGIHDERLLEAIRTCLNVFLSSRSVILHHTAHTALTQIIDAVFGRMELLAPEREHSQWNSHLLSFLSDSQSPATTRSELESANVSEVTGDVHGQVVTLLDEMLSTVELRISGEQVPSADPSRTSTVTQEAFETAQKDAFLVFRSLCKLSNKQIPASSSAESVDVRVKIFSLQRILELLSNAGPAFRSSPMLVAALRQHLFQSLLENGVCQIPEVFRLAVDIFYAIMEMFKEHLKMEIGVFFSNIFLAILKSAHGTMHQKHVVLRVLLRICKTPQMLVDIFLNYDCNLETLNIFENLVNDLSRIAQGSVAHEAEVQSSRELALECLVLIVGSMVEWAKPFMESRTKTVSDAVNDAEETPIESASDVSSVHGDDDGEASGAALNGRDVIEKYENQMKLKSQFRRACDRFALSSKRGIQELQQQGFVGESPREVALFFVRNGSALNKRSIGDYMGENKEFNRAVMHAFVDALNFRGMSFVDALRYFLSLFLIPGESQIIDRFVLKFAERYCQLNPSVFKIADTAYVLAYSVLMLNTDAHNPKVKGRMTLEDFLKNNRGIDDSGDIDEQMLSDIYMSITTRKLLLRDDFGDVDMAVGKSKRALFNQETERMVEKSKRTARELRKAMAHGKGGEFYTAIHVEHVRPMFGQVWAPLMAAFSFCLEEELHPVVFGLCLKGFRSAIRLACFFEMETERSAYINALTKFTYLTNLREMTTKNVESIRSLMEVAESEGNYLKDSWYQILKCVSQLERMQVIRSGQSHSPFVSDSQSVPAAVSFGLMMAGPSTPQARRASVDFPSSEHRKLQFTRGKLSKVETANAQFVEQALDLQQSIDSVFAGTINLDGDAVVDFFAQLCAISLEEIAGPVPRIFSLQKLVEISYFNMSRIRFVWSKIWAILSKHFIRCVDGPNQKVSEYALDSLRQLAMKFLEKDELAHYHFQKDFLRPFLHIMQHVKSPDVREYCLISVQQMVRARAKNIRSGWRAIFGVLEVAASSDSVRLISVGADTLRLVVTEYQSLIADTFVDCINALGAFVANPHCVQPSLESIDALRECAVRLAGPTFDCSGEDQQVTYWFPVFTGLSRAISTHPRSRVRVRSLAVLFTILYDYGHIFSSSVWLSIFKGVIVPLFDDVSLLCQDSSAQPTKDPNEILAPTLQHVAGLYERFYDKTSFLLPEVLRIFSMFLKQAKQQNLTRIGANVLLELARNSGKRWGEVDTGRVCALLAELVHETLPVELMKEKEGSGGDESIEDHNACYSGPEPKAEESPVIVESEKKAVEFEEDGPLEEEQGKKLDGSEKAAEFEEDGPLEEEQGKKLDGSEKAVEFEEDGPLEEEQGKKLDGSEKAVEFEEDGPLEEEQGKKLDGSEKAVEFEEDGPLEEEQGKKLDGSSRSGEADGLGGDGSEKAGRTELPQDGTPDRPTRNEDSDNAFTPESTPTPIRPFVTSPTLADSTGGKAPAARPKRGPGEGFQRIRAKCVTQLVLIKLIADIGTELFDSLVREDFDRISSALCESFSFARGFDDNDVLRTYLWREGQVGPHIPTLLKQEVNSSTARITLLFRWFEKHGSYEDQLIQSIKDVLVRFATHAISEAREEQSWTPLAVFILSKLDSMDNDVAARFFDALQLELIGLLPSRAHAIHIALHRCLRRGRIVFSAEKLS